MSVGNPGIQPGGAGRATSTPENQQPAALRGRPRTVMPRRLTRHCRWQEEGARRDCTDPRAGADRVDEEKLGQAVYEQLPGTHPGSEENFEG